MRSIPGGIPTRECEKQQLPQMSVSHSAQYEPTRVDVWTVLKELPHRVGEPIEPAAPIEHHNIRGSDYYS